MHPLNRRITYIFTIAFLLLSNIAFGQWRLIMEFKVTDEGARLPAAEINVFRDGKFVEKVYTDGKGNADIPMDPGGIYTIEIGGSDGFVKKKLEVNTKSVPAGAAEGDQFLPAEVELFQKIEGLDYHVLDEPIGKFLYSEDFGGFDVDLDYTKQRKKALDQLEKDFLAQKAKEAESQKERERQYAEAIKIADKAFATEDWEKAEQEYLRAEKLNPLETYPSFQLAELKSKLIELREVNKKYDEAIQKADAADAAKDFQAAVALYQKASSIKPNEQYPKTKVSEIQGMLASQAKADQEYLAAIEKGDRALQSNDLEGAKAAFETASQVKPAEEYPKNKIAEINDIIQKKDAKEKEYQDAITAGDNALAAKDYENAKSNYQKALGIKPTEKYPQAQIDKVDGLLASAAKTEQEYLAAIEKADQALSANQHATAKTAYQEASKIKPSEEYPKNKIQEIDQYLAAQAEKDKEYQDKIKEADGALASKDYEGAKSAYQAASSIKPIEEYPKTKIGEIDGILANLAKQEENYNAAIKKGDQALASKDYEGAKSAYQEALGVKPDEKYPQEKLDEIGGILVSMQKTNEEYNKAIQDGDDALANKDYDKAKGFYNNAIALKGEEQYPKDKIQEIDNTLAKQAEEQKQYDDAIAAGDQAMQNGELEEAKNSYNAALKVRPEEDYPKTQIGKIDQQLAANQELDQNYNAAIQKGDQAFASNDYANAIKAYEEALALKKEESYPQEKIDEAKGKIAEIEAQENAYAEAIKKGDAAFKSKSWEDAKQAYSDALAIKQDDYPKGKIEEIDATLNQLAEEAAAAEKLEADYEAAIEEGDQKLGSEDYEGSKAAFQRALSLKSDEKYPKEKIEEIEETVARLAEEKAEEERLAAQQKEYDALIAKADGLLGKEQLDEARTEYQAALAIKGDEQYPKDKIEEINGILADAQEQEKKYNDLIASADGLLGKDKYEEAKGKYQEASAVKTEEQYPKDKIKEIDEKLNAIAQEQEEIRLQQEKEAETDARYQALIDEGDQLLKDKELEASKSKFEEAIGVKDEQYPKDKIAEIEGLIVKRSEDQAKEAAAAEQAKIEEEYQAIIDAADQFFGAKDYDNAKSKYEEALTVKQESYPQEKIQEIENLLAQLADQEAKEAAAAEQAKIDEEYQAIIDAADQLFGAKDYNNAKSKYEEALTVKQESYPQEKIQEIENLLAQLADQEAKEAAAAKQAEIDQEYQNLIGEADSYFDSEDYTQAKELYNNALAVKDEQYPKDQIAEIDRRLSAQAANEAAAAEQAKIETQYLAVLEKADNALNAKQWNEALQHYSEASSLKPAEEYPKNKIAEINDLLAQAKAAEQAKEVAKENAFLELIQQADQEFEAKRYLEAKKIYQDALGISDEQYPKDQIALIDRLMAEAKAKEEEIRIAQEREARNNESYNAAVLKGDELFKNQDYVPAKNEYQLANGLKPSETYPQEQIEKINQILSQQAAAAAEADRKRQEIADKEKRFDELITAADFAFERKSYRLAKRDYQSALDLKPDRAYAKEQLQKVVALIEKERQAELARVEEESKPIQIKTGPRATINNKAEQDLDKVYQDMWAKRNGEKREELEQKTEVVKNLQDAFKEKEEENQQAEIDRIEAISVSVDESKSVSDKFYMQNLETVQDKEVAVQEYKTELNIESQRDRGDVFASLSDKQEIILTYQSESNEELVDGKKEEVEEDYDELSEINQYRTQKQSEKIKEEEETYVRKAKDIETFNQGKSAELLEKNTGHIKDVQEDWDQTIKGYNKELGDKISANQENINDKALEIQQYKSSRSDHYMENKEIIEEKTEDLKEVQEEWNAEAEEKRQENKDPEFYEGEDKPRQDRLAGELPQGVTEEVIENTNGSTTLRRYVVNGTQTDVYEKTYFTWGGKVTYTKNGTHITSETWDSESK